MVSSVTKAFNTHLVHKKLFSEKYITDLKLYLTRLICGYILIYIAKYKW